MAQYKPFESQKKKISYIAEESIDIDNNIVELQDKESFQLKPVKDFYKNAKLLYSSTWRNAEFEKITEAVSTTMNTLLPERAKYQFSVPLSLSEEFLPYLKIEVLAKTNPDLTIRGVYAFESSLYREIQFNFYTWKGITFTSGCCPQPAQAYSHQPGGGCPCGFLYPVINFPIPLGVDVTHVLPIGTDIIGYDNRLIYEIGGGTSESWWEDNGIVSFQQVVNYYGLAGAKSVIDTYFDNVIYVETAYPYRALESVISNQVISSNQAKKILKNGTNDYTLDVTGDFLLISPANEETNFSDPAFPTYQPNGGDLQVKLRVYLTNPNYYSERKYYSNGE